MTSYETIRNLFNSTAICRHGEQPKIDYQPGCIFIECSKGDECKCRLNDGDGGPITPFLAKWNKQYAK